MIRLHTLFSVLSVAALAMAMFISPSMAELPDPDGKPADMSKPVQVYIIMGQSNTLEMGKVKGGEGSLENATKNKGLYSYLIDDDGNWTKRQDVRNVSVMMSRGNTRVYRNDWLTISGGRIGIEIGIGHYLGEHTDAPVMILKSSIGNRSLGWDLLPPGAERFEFEENGVTYVYPGYKDEIRHGRWEKGTTPEVPKHTWYAGKQYDDDVANAKKILAELPKYYPGATDFEVKGFFWWQGDKDMRNMGHATQYEKNLIHLINALRKDFNAPDAPFVLATLGQTTMETGGGQGKLRDAKMNVADGSKYPDLKDEVITIFTNPLSKGSSSSAHYGGNAETYMNVGEAMGKAMVELQKKK